MATESNYTYKALLLTRKESIDGNCLGLKYAIKKESEWKDITGCEYELQTCDRGVTNLVIDNKVYMIHRDFIMFDKGVRLFICKSFDAEVDKIEVVDETESDENKINNDTHNVEKPEINIMAAPASLSENYTDGRIALTEEN